VVFFSLVSVPYWVVPVKFELDRQGRLGAGRREDRQVDRQRQPSAVIKVADSAPLVSKFRCRPARAGTLTGRGDVLVDLVRRVACGAAGAGGRRPGSR
jgi:hypothetical protein